MSWLLPAAALLLIFAGRRKDEREADAEEVETERRRIVEQAKSELSPLEETALREVVDVPAGPVKAPKRATRRDAPGRRATRPAKRSSTTRASKSTGGDDEAALIRQAAEAALAAERAAEKDDQPSVPSGVVKARPVPAKPAQPTRAPARVTARKAVAREEAPAKPLPPGYDPDAARRQAQSAANHVRKREYDYSRKLLRDWQTLAGLKPDGIYGPKTRSALEYFGAKAPKPLFRRRKDKSIIRDSDPDAQYIPPEAR